MNRFPKLILLCWGLTAVALGVRYAAIAVTQAWEAQLHVLAVTPVVIEVDATEGLTKSPLRRPAHRCPACNTTMEDEWVVHYYEKGKWYAVPKQGHPAQEPIRTDQGQRGVPKAPGGLGPDRRREGTPPDSA